ncbi:MAG: hypothetical protein ACK5LX_12760 [Oscillospiraceae bacterium]
MMDVRGTLRSYRENIEAVRDRIQHLHREVAKCGGEGNSKSYALRQRRRFLYEEMAEMQEAARLLEDYLAKTGEFLQ